MKYSFSKMLAVVALSVSLGSCLKDKGFEDLEYGVNLDKQPFDKSVAMPMGLNDPSDNVYSVEVSNTPQTIEAPTVVVSIEEPAPYDIHIQMVRKDSLVLAYNQSPSKTIELSSMAPSLYQIPSLELVIPAGKRSGVLKIVIPNGSQLDPLLSYGFGFQIAGVRESGFNIAGNQKNAIVVVAAKNKYDGIYRVRGYGFLGGNTTAPYLFNIGCSSIYTVEMTTAGPASVNMSGQPLARNGGIIQFSNVLPTIIFDPATNKVTNVTAQPGSTGFVFPFDPTYDSRYDPATKTIYVKYGFQLVASWNVIDTLVYCGPR